jgi:hypothetical protein
VGLKLAMKIKSLFAKPFASYIYNKIRKGMTTALADQDAIFKELIKVGKATEFGKITLLPRLIPMKILKKRFPLGITSNSSPT